MSTQSISFKEQHSFEERQKESEEVLTKYSGRVPVIVEKYGKCGEVIPTINKNKFLVPNDITIGQFTYIIRKRIQLAPEQAIFLFVGKYNIPATSKLISEVYENFKDDDGFLYMVYSGENTFG